MFFAEFKTSTNSRSPAATTSFRKSSGNNDLSTLSSQHVLDQSLNAASHTGLANQITALTNLVTALTARVTALEGQRLTTKLDPNVAALDVDQITFDSSHFGKQYFSASKTLRVYTGSTPPTNPPY